MKTVFQSLEPCHMKMGLNASAKSIDSGQTAGTAQADLGQNFFFALGLCVCMSRDPSL